MAPSIHKCLFLIVLIVFELCKDSKLIWIYQHKAFRIILQNAFFVTFSCK